MVKDKEKKRKEEKRRKEKRAKTKQDIFSIILIFLDFSTILDEKKVCRQPAGVFCFMCGKR